MKLDQGEDDMYGLGPTTTLDFLPDDVMLPVQFFEGLRRNAHDGDGCRRLLYAIFENALRTFLRLRVTTNGGHGGPSTTKRERLYQEAKAWLFEERYDGPFSCIWICDHLGIEVTALRKALREAGQVPVVIPRRAPMGTHCSVLALPRVRAKRSGSGQV